MMKSGDRVMVPRTDGSKSPATILYVGNTMITVALEERDCGNQPQEKNVAKGDVTLIPFRFSHVSGAIYRLDKTCQSCNNKHLAVVG